MQSKDHEDHHSSHTKDKSERSPTEDWTPQHSLEETVARISETFQDHHHHHHAERGRQTGTTLPTKTSAKRMAPARLKPARKPLYPLGDDDSDSDVDEPTTDASATPPLRALSSEADCSDRDGASTRGDDDDDDDDKSGPVSWGEDMMGEEAAAELGEWHASSDSEDGEHASEQDDDLHNDSSESFPDLCVASKQPTNFEDSSVHRDGGGDAEEDEAVLVPPMHFFPSSPSCSSSYHSPIQSDRSDPSFASCDEFPSREHLQDECGNRERQSPARSIAGGCAAEDNGVAAVPPSSSSTTSRPSVSPQSGSEEDEALLDAVPFWATRRTAAAAPGTYGKKKVVPLSPPPTSSVAHGGGSTPSNQTPSKQIRSPPTLPPLSGGGGGGGEGTHSSTVRNLWGRRRRRREEPHNDGTDDDDVREGGGGGDDGGEGEGDMEESTFSPLALDVVTLQDRLAAGALEAIDLTDTPTSTSGGGGRGTSSTVKDLWEGPDNSDDTHEGNPNPTLTPTLTLALALTLTLALALALNPSP